MIQLLTSLCISTAFLFGSLLIPQTGWASWWTSITIEESSQPEPSLTYQRVLFTKTDQQPVRAHIVNVTGVGTEYIFGVLGSYGVLVQPSVIARNSNATLVVNGGFFSKSPTRANGMVMAHGRVLYPPRAGSSLHATVGFSPAQVLFDWITPEHLMEDRFLEAKDEWNQCHAALGAGPMLIRNGEFRQEWLKAFNEELVAPRSAIGNAVDGSVLIIVVDGRQPGWSAGVTLEELAMLSLEYEAVEALNLDGGGSSSLVIQNIIMNRPSDYALPGQPGKERAVANVIALFPRS